MSGKSRKAGNLVALGSAAVVAVYGTGFMRTADAAQRFAEQSDERVLSPEDAAGAAPSGTTLVPAIAGESGEGARSGRLVLTTRSAQPNSVNKADATIARVDPSTNSNAVVRTTTVPARAVQGQTAEKTNAPDVPATAREISIPIPPEVTTVLSASGVAVSSGAAPATPAPAPSVETKPVAEKAVAAAPVQVAVAPVVTPPPAPVSAPPAVTSAEPVPASSGASVKWKDGEYTGYGTSRHGDVEVYLETTDGKITYIKISQCLTQYSCSWIADLPRQVLARQSTKVDAVSGATQSANAFYYAVVQALAKSK